MAQQASTQPSNGQPRERGVVRAVQLLDHLHRLGRAVRVGDLARGLDAPRSSTYELVKVLTEAGILETVTPEGDVFFGRRLYFYGLDYLREHDLVRRGQAEVDRLAAETGETTQLCTRTGGRYTVLYMRASSRPFQISSEIGTEIPLPWTASGRLLLAHLPEAEIRGLVDPADLTLPSGETIGMVEFLAAVAAAGRDGWCMTSGLVDAFTHCIAGPIHDAEGRASATLCFVVPVDTPDARVAQLRERLLAACAGLSLPRRRSATPRPRAARRS